MDRGGDVRNTQGRVEGSETVKDVSPKKKKAQPVKGRGSIYERNVVGPSALEIGSDMRNPALIAAWWERVKLYTEAMEALDRVVLIHRAAATWYLSSAESQP